MLDSVIHHQDTVVERHSPLPNRSQNLAIELVKSISNASIACICKYYLHDILQMQV